MKIIGVILLITGISETMYVTFIDPEMIKCGIAASFCSGVIATLLVFYDTLTKN